MKENWDYKTEFKEVAKNALDDAGIKIPFPQRVAWEGKSKYSGCKNMSFE